MSTPTRSPSKVTLTVTANAWTWRIHAFDGVVLAEHTMQRLEDGFGFKGTKKGGMPELCAAICKQAGWALTDLDSLAEAIEDEDPMKIAGELQMGDADPADPGWLVVVPKPKGKGGRPRKERP